MIGAEGILRCSTKSLLLITINESTIHTIHTMINHRQFIIAYLGLCLRPYDTEPFALRGLRQNDSLFETKRILFLVALRYPYYTRVY